MDLDRALVFSRYASRLIAAQPWRRAELLQTVGLPFPWETAKATLAPTVAGEDARALARALREMRRCVLLHTLARDLTQQAPLHEVCAAMTTLAETAIAAAVAFHTRRLAQDRGTPVAGDEGPVQELIVVGMGKLGGGELNVSSDVDLVFLYPNEGATHGPRPLSNREFFDRLGRAVISALNEVTDDGFVFRVDMRLRPYGESGPLTTTFAGLETYLITQGRTWERYAWQKARALTGQRDAELSALITPFVYRKYLDFDAYAGLRDIHRQIRDMGVRRDYEANIKLGEGGIREIEFIVQALQLVRGGRDPALRDRSTLAALDALVLRGLVPGNAAQELRSAYLFLRALEHRLQYRDDAQTHQLPSDPVEQEALAEAMGLQSRDEFDRVLAHLRSTVAAQFGEVLGRSASAKGHVDERFASIWEDPAPTPEAIALLGHAGFEAPAELLTSLARVRTSGRYQQLPATSRERFDVLVPLILECAVAHPSLAGAQTVFLRLLSLLETVSRRSAYLALVIEHPPLLPRLANLMGASPWAADYLTRHPLLLDELLDARALLAEPSYTAWRSELEAQLATQSGDAEAQMDTLRHFQHAQSFRLLARDLNGLLTVERLADDLSALADLVLDAALEACWRNMTQPLPAQPRFAIIGYGKLGGKELGYASDLDLVFLYDRTEGEPDADALPERYMRLAQRLNTWLTATTAAGRLYETDLRLRPNGDAGQLACSFDAFRKYQHESAWTWEHQALTRARFAAGDAALGARFEAEREAILRLPRAPHALARDVVAMRRRMHAGHPNRTPAFDLKHDEGGMVDIEFVVQYLVLAHAARYPTLTRNAGNIALLELAGQLELVPRDTAHHVADAYREFRRAQHRIRLTGADHARVDAQTFVAERAAVVALWSGIFGGPWPGAPESDHPGPARGRHGEFG